MNTRSRRTVKRVPSIFDDASEDDDDEEDVFISPSKKARICSSESSDEQNQTTKEGGALNLSDCSDSEEDESQLLTQRTSSDASNVNSSVVLNGSDDNEDSCQPVKDADLYDFSEIIKTQDFMKQCQNFAEPNESKAPYEFKPTEVFELKETHGLVKGKKKSGVRNISTRSKPAKKVIKNSSKEDQIDLNVSELLAIGEAGQTKSEDESSDPGEGTSTSELAPDKNIEIKINMPGTFSRRKKRRQEMEEALKRQLRAVRRHNQVFYHKVSLLCLLAHGNYVNSVILDEDILGMALSIIPSENFYPPKLASCEYIEKLVNWFNKKIKIEPKKSTLSIFNALTEQFAEKVAYTKKYKVIMFVCIIRVLGLPCRLVLNLTPIPLRPPTDDPLLDAKAKKQKKTYDDEVSSDEDLTIVSLTEPSKHMINESEHFSSEKTARKSANLQKRTKKLPNLDKNAKKSFEISSEKSVKTSGTIKSKNNKKFVRKETVKKCEKKIIDRRVLSSDEEEEFTKKKEKEKVDYWAEIYLESEEMWVSVDAIQAKVKCSSQLSACASHPVAYVLAWNEDGSIKDVTKRYSTQRIASVKKFHVEEDWWVETMKPWRPRKNKRERAEDADLERTLADQPLPASIADYKNHPLYALRRHLLKFEGIYPDDAPPLGFVKKEPVYSRMLVVQLHSRETWFREAKVVKIGEKPFKVVKARPKYDKLSGQRLEDKPLDLFGYWQVVDYIPPIATDGKVPKNMYGNVELYKPSMLPIGTVHLQVPGLMRIAKKLNIDCAPALIGWEYSGGGSHPIMDGFIVCEEFRDKILDLWAQDVDETAKKEKEKNKQRIYDNWKRLIKGLIIRERLEKRYNFSASDIDSRKYKFKNSKPHAKRK